MPNQADLKRSNDAFQSAFTQGGLPMPPARKLAIVTCMDARLHPEKFLGLAIGDAHVIRNAGGRVSDDALRSLVISQRLLGTQEVVVIHHTDCGMETFENQDLVKVIERDLGADAATTVQGRDFLPFKGMEQSVRNDIATVKASPLIPKDIPVYGYVYDVKTGGLIKVD
ncbi:hypothetical protein WJX72_007124 [[Myrmecia] bisecta]|uniref:Carbonic anhydrase n=1 Tax=[Myrmecia] bisecta TaxID=41462 RepID=A0AAW1Q2F7_9CHLO